MKINAIKKAACVTFTLSLLSSAAQSGENFSDVFTEDIYKQKAIRLSPEFQRANGAEKKTLLLNHLKEKKLEALSENCLKQLKKEIDIWEAEYDSAIRVRNDRDKRLFINHVVTSVFQGVLSLIPFVGQTIATLITSENQVLNNLPSIAVNPAGMENWVDRALTCDPVSLKEKIMSLEIAYQKKRDALDQEPIKALEKQYVLKRKEIKKDLRKAIEEELLNARNSNYPPNMTRRFLENALRLPLQTKQLLDLRDPDQSRGLLLERFHNDLKFQNYESEAREKIGEIITHAASHSMISDHEDDIKRQLIYVWGDPSSGKSTAAREIPKFLGLPHYEMTARSASSFSEQNIEGSEAGWGNPNTGWIAKALMAMSSLEKVPYKNAFLIINELDKLLDDTEVSNFLLDFLDPQKTEYFNNYFRGKIDISRLNIIITANRAIPQNLDALRTRITSIEFPKFSDAVIQEILNNDLKKLCINYSIPKIFSFGYRDPMTIVGQYADNLFQRYAGEDVRSSLSRALSSFDIDPDREVPSFLYKTGVTEEESQKITIRELTTKLDCTMNRFADKLSQKSRQWLESAANPNISEEDKLKLYKQAALVGNTKARLKLAEILEAGNNAALAKLWYAQIVLGGNFENLQDHDALLTAIQNNQDIGNILGAHLEPSRNPFHIAAREGRRELLLALLKLYPEGINLNDEERNTLIITAAAEGHLNLVELLHRFPATLEANVRKQTALQVAQMKSWENTAGNNNYLEITKFLLQEEPELIKSFKEGKDLKNNLLKQVEEITDTDHARYSKALKILGDIYAQGLGVYSDREEAYRFYRKAVEGGNRSFTLDYDMHLLSINNINNTTRKVCTSFRDGENWRYRAISDNWQAREQSGYSAHTISAVNFKGRSYVATLGRSNASSSDNNKILLASYADNQQLEDPSEIDLPRQAALGGVSLSSFKGKLYLSYIGTDYKVWLCSSSDGRQWEEARTPNENWRSSYQTSSLTNFKGQLYLVHQGEYHDRGIWLSSSKDGINWEAATNIIKNLEANISKTALCLTSFKDKLYLGYLGGAYYWGNCAHTPQKMWLTSSKDLGRTWKEPIIIMPQKETNRISLTSFKDKLYFAYRDTGNGKIWLTSSEDGETWPDPQESGQNSSDQFCLAPLLKVTANNAPR